jgi:hypothetical protein
MEETPAKVGEKRSGSKAGLNGLVTAKWKVELPNIGAGDEQFGGCRSVEHCYKKEQQIGEGTYGQVYLAQDVADGSQVALKKVSFLLVAWTLRRREGGGGTFLAGGVDRSARSRPWAGQPLGSIARWEAQKCR